VTYFWHFGTPSISRERFELETSNLACRLITVGTNDKNEKLGQRGSGRGHMILHRCLQQDGAPSHTARNTPTYLRRENVTFIEPHMWPQNSPELNHAVDCAVWGAIQQMVYQRRRFTTINQLKQAIVTERGKLLQRFIDRAIVSGVTGLSGSSRSKANKLNI